MKVVILAGGLGTRISEETESKPKPMVLIDDKPILWHLMNIFDSQGFTEFIIALGYRGEVIKRWLADINDLSGSLVIETKNRNFKHFGREVNFDWKVTALETGLNSQTGGRIKKCMEAFPRETLVVTYGDGLANIDLKALLEFHKSHGKLATVTAVRPPARFGSLEISGGAVTYFGEKVQSDAGWINGGFFVLSPQVADFISDDLEPFETGALPRLVTKGELMAFQHPGFWHPMDTLRDKNELAKLALEQTPPWLNYNL
jgi:glucose-1-phosphate cytidylyltransferase